MGNAWMKMDEIFHNRYIYVPTYVNEKMTQEEIEGINWSILMIEREDNKDMSHLPSHCTVFVIRSFSILLFSFLFCPVIDKVFNLWELRILNVIERSFLAHILKFLKYLLGISNLWINGHPLSVNYKMMTKLIIRLF